MEIERTRAVHLFALTLLAVTLVSCGCSVPVKGQEKPEWRFIGAPSALLSQSEEVTSAKVLDPSDVLLAALAGRTGLRALSIRFEQRTDACRYARLDGLKNLQVLQVVDRGAMTKRICTDIAQLKDLTSLDLEFSENSPEAEFEFLPTSVRVLRLKIHGLERGSLSVLANLQSLQELDVSSCFLAMDDQILKAIAALPLLDALNFGFGPAVTEEGQKHIGSNKTLRRLSVQWPTLHGKPCLLNDAWIGSLNCLPNLLFLEVSGSSVVLEEGATWLRLARSLSSLKLYGCHKITDKALSEIENCHALESLDLRNCRGLKNSGLAPCHRLRNLRSLKVSSSFDGDDFELVAKCVSLQELDCLYSPAMAAQLPKLRDLRKIRIGSRVQEACLAALAELAELREVTLSECYDLTDGSLAEIAKVDKLEALELNIPRQITDKALDVLGEFRSLRSLTLSGSHLLTGRNLGKCAELTSLVVVDCPKFGDDFCKAFGTLGKLREARFEHCPDVSAKIQSLREAQPGAMIMVR